MIMKMENKCLRRCLDCKKLLNSRAKKDSKRCSKCSRLKCLKDYKEKMK
jgi:hypothetical protein